jgi:hypothetical protein
MLDERRVPVVKAKMQGRGTKRTLGAKRKESGSESVGCGINASRTGARRIREKKRRKGKREKKRRRRLNRYQHAGDTTS